MTNPARKNSNKLGFGDLFKIYKDAMFHKFLYLPPRKRNRRNIVPARKQSTFMVN